MPITKSAKKSLRQETKRRARNLKYKKKIKDLKKQILNLVNQKKIKEVQELLPNFYKTVDKAAKVGVIKKNTASRKKSRLSRLLSSIKS